MTALLVCHDALTPAQLAAIVQLCMRAYEEDFAAYVPSWAGGTHVLLMDGDQLVAHVMWLERVLHRRDQPPLAAAYVEAVATEPAWQGGGHGTAAMRAINTAIGGYEIGALSPSAEPFYARTGWESWRGQLFARHADGRWTPEPGEEAMILRTPRTPPLDITADLAADWRPGDVW